jgi:hypothetical protein
LMASLVDARGKIARLERELEKLRTLSLQEPERVDRVVNEVRIGIVGNARD